MFDTVNQNKYNSACYCGLVKFDFLFINIKLLEDLVIFNKKFTNAKPKGGKRGAFPKKIRVKKLQWS